MHIFIIPEGKPQEHSLRQHVGSDLNPIDHRLYLGLAAASMVTLLALVPQITMWLDMDGGSSTPALAGVDRLSWLH